MKELVRPKFWQAVLFWPKSRRQGRVGLGVDRWWKACVWASVYYASVCDRASLWFIAFAMF